jgi:ATP-dependent DNA ligase
MAPDTGATAAPPLTVGVEPMLARLARTLPVGAEWTYEPKWDGFRCLAFRDGDDVDLRSRNQRPFARYFPEVVTALRLVPERRFVLDGELVVVHDDAFDFAALMSRLHPADSRVRTLAEVMPATYVAFDLLATGATTMLATPFADRRVRLEQLLQDAGPRVCLSPATGDVDVAREWLNRSGSGIDGVVAKRVDEPYRPGKRAMVKVKLERTADCVVGGFRVFADGTVSSLLLGLYDRADDGRDVLRHVGVAASFNRARREELLHDLAPHVVALAGHPWANGFALGPAPMGRLKGAAGRWTPDMPLDWVPIAPRLVCEVAFDQVDGGRFRHPARWRHWRPDRSPHTCRLDQLDPPVGDDRTATVSAP